MEPHTNLGWCVFFACWFVCLFWGSSRIMLESCVWIVWVVLGSFWGSVQIDLCAVFGLFLGWSKTLCGIFRATPDQPAVPQAATMSSRQNANMCRLNFHQSSPQRQTKRGPVNQFTSKPLNQYYYRGSHRKLRCKPQRNLP